MLVAFYSVSANVLDHDLPIRPPIPPKSASPPDARLQITGNAANTLVAGEFGLDGRHFGGVGVLKRRATECNTRWPKKPKPRRSFQSREARASMLTRLRHLDAR